MPTLPRFLLIEVVEIYVTSTNRPAGLTDRVSKEMLFLLSAVGLLLGIVAVTEIAFTGEWWDRFGIPLWMGLGIAVAFVGHQTDVSVRYPAVAVFVFSYVVLVTGGFISPGTSLAATSGGVQETSPAEQYVNAAAVGAIITAVLVGVGTGLGWTAERAREDGSL